MTAQGCSKFTWTRRSRPTLSTRRKRSPPFTRSSPARKSTSSSPSPICKPRTSIIHRRRGGDLHPVHHGLKESVLFCCFFPWLITTSVSDLGTVSLIGSRLILILKMHNRHPRRNNLGLMGCIARHSLGLMPSFSLAWPPRSPESPS